VGALTAVNGLLTYALRLRPGQDLRRELVAFAERNGLQAAFVLTCVGSLRHAALRLANQPGTTHYEDKFEIVALVGTLCPDGPHLHIALSDGQGRTIGGHLQEGSLIYTTAEVVLGDLPNVSFCRPLDAETGYDELVVQERSQ
jgi:predicted DNA-binding protein with PD1-like motif